jgi:Family of unknown function (DUF5691)
LSLVIGRLGLVVGYLFPIAYYLLLVWQTLVTAATIGTDRQPFALPKATDNRVATPKEYRLDRLLAKIDTTDPAKALLSAAAAVRLAQKAGRVPVVPDFEAVSPFPPKDLPVCGEDAAHSLQRMLAGEFLEVMPEWLAAVTAARLRVPPEYLPDLLNWGNRHPQWKLPILEVLGDRGRWLAAQNPDWQYAEASIDRSIWETGTSAMRLWVLQLLRNRDPDRAREWVSSTWKQDKAPDRAAFLATFKMRLSLAEESLLESALDDKSKQVRAIAADLLTRMPESQLTYRAIDRISTVMRIVTQPSLQIEVILPNECSEMALRDGIVPQSSSGMEEKAGWLMQMLGQVPPSVWTREASPGELLSVAAGSEWYAAFLQGWSIAAERHQNIEWAEALLTVLPKFPGIGNNLSELSQNLMDLLPIDRRESLVWQVLQEDTGDTPLESLRERLKKNHPLLFLLKLCRHLWSIELSLAVLNRVAIEISTSQDNYNWGVRSIVKDCAYFINTAVIADADRLLKLAVKAESYWEQTVDELLEILQFRHEMLGERFSSV